MLVVVVASVPDLLLRQLSVLMAASRVITLIISLLLVTIGGLICCTSAPSPMW